MLTDKLPVQTGAKKHEMTRTGIFTGLRVLLKICSHVAAHADILKLQKPTHAQPKLEAALSFTSQLNHYSKAEKGKAYGWVVGNIMRLEIRGFHL